MMRVLINDVPNKPHAQTGQVLDLPDAEATDMIARGSAVLAPALQAPVAAEPPAPVAPVLDPPEHHEAKKAKKAR